MKYTYAIAFVAVLVVSNLTACQTNSPGKLTTTSNTPAVKAQPVTLKSNLAVYPVHDDIASDAIKLLSNYLIAVNANDRDGLRKLLAPYFTQTIAVDDQVQLTLNRDEFIDIYSKKRNPITGFYIRDISKSGEYEYTAIVKQEKVGRYFSSNSLETFVISTREEAITSRVTTGLYPDPYPDGAARIYLRYMPVDRFYYSKNWTKLVAEIGPDAVIDEYRKSEVDNIPGNEAEHSVFIVFNEPIKSKTEIVVKHQFHYKDKWYKPFIFNYFIENPSEYLVIENMTRSGSPVGNETVYSVYVNGKLIQSRTVLTW